MPNNDTKATSKGSFPSLNLVMLLEKCIWDK